MPFSLIWLISYQVYRFTLKSVALFFLVTFHDDLSVTRLHGINHQYSGFASWHIRPADANVIATAWCVVGKKNTITTHAWTSLCIICCMVCACAVDTIEKKMWWLGYYIAVTADLLNTIYAEQTTYWNIFLVYPRRQVSTFHANCLRWRQFACNIKSYFLGK